MFDLDALAELDRGIAALPQDAAGLTRGLARAADGAPGQARGAVAPAATICPESGVASGRCPFFHGDAA